MIASIVAFDEQQLIGKDNALPWHFPADLKYFKQVTTGHPILMGRKTFESIIRFGKPLPNRHHYVLTRDPHYRYDHPDVTILSEAETLLTAFQERADETLFIIGGATIYEQTLPWINQLYVTHIPGTYEGDTYFPIVDWSQFKCIQSQEESGLTFNIYQKQ